MIRILKTLTVLAFISILSVLPFCLYMEQIGNEWIEQQSAHGIKFKKEGLEYLLLYGFSLYSIPFLIWTATIYRKPTVKKFIDLVIIIFVGVIPALLLNFFFYSVLNHHNN